MPRNRPPFFNPQRRPNPEKQTRRRGGDPSCPSHRSATKTRVPLIYALPMYFSHAGFDEPGGAGSAARFFTFLFAEALGRAGQITDALAAIEQAIVRSERTEER
jgi:hypothetical protein